MFSTPSYDQQLGRRAKEKKDMTKRNRDYNTKILVNSCWDRFGKTRQPSIMSNALLATVLRYCAGKDDKG